MDTPRAVLAGTCCLVPIGCVGTAENGADSAAVARTLDSFHLAASEADLDAYFDAMSGDAVFLGTDATERWGHAEFLAFCRPYFESGRGWTYTPTERHVEVRGDTAWFDELLDNASYGTCRGSGVLVREDGAWRVAHYNLSLMVPNGVATDVVEIIRGSGTPEEPGR